MCFVLRRADALLSNSDFTGETLVDLIGVDPGRVELVYPTVDEERFRPGLAGDDLRAGIGVAAGQKLILSVGRLMRRKGFDSVIRALPRLRQQGIDAHYAVIGIGEDREHLRGLAAELGVTERVHLLGHVSYEDLPRWYCASDVFAMPNRDIGGDTEGFGLVYLEAAAAGTARRGGHGRRNRFRGRGRRHRPPGRWRAARRDCAGARAPAVQRGGSCSGWVATDARACWRTTRTSGAWTSCANWR